METNAPYITNLVNSIIGVSVLAMPFCMKKCGLLLGLGLLIGMSWLTYISCNMLINSAHIKRRRTYEYLAFYTVGSSGKFAVELSMIGLMLGTCVAFYVIIGDLATAVLHGMVNTETVQLRTFVIVFCALCIALPLGLMKNLSVLGFIGFFSVIFYVLFVCVMIANSISSGFLTFDWMSKIDLVRPAGVFQCLPIFSLAFGCQCQLFVVYDSLEDPSVMRMEKIVVQSLKIVTTVYCMVAILGYTTYYDAVEGNVLKNFSENFILDLIKFGFAISVVVGFPLMIFPCRQSIYTLFFSQHPVDGVPSSTYIEPFMFKSITLLIVLSTMMVAIFIPNVETILGLTGATMGSFIFFIFPGVIFSKASPKGNNGISKFVLAVGCILLILCTYSNVYSASEVTNTKIKNPLPLEIDQPALPNNPQVPVNNLPEAVKKESDQEIKQPVAEVVDFEHRHEPANPIEPVAIDNNESDNQDRLKKEENNKKPEFHNAQDINNQKLPEKNEENSQHNQPQVNKAAIQNTGNSDLGKAEHIKSDSIESPKKANSAVETVKEVVVIPKQDSIHDQAIKNVDSAQVKESAVGVRDLPKVDKSDIDTAVKVPETVDEEKLLNKIKEQHKIQHELLDAQEVLIQALEKKHEIQKVESPVENVKSDNAAVQNVVSPANKVEQPVKKEVKAADLHNIPPHKSELENHQVAAAKTPKEEQKQLSNVNQVNHVANEPKVLPNAKVDAVNSNLAKQPALSAGANGINDGLPNQNLKVQSVVKRDIAAASNDNTLSQDSQSLDAIHLEEVKDTFQNESVKMSNIKSADEQVPVEDSNLNKNEEEKTSNEKVNGGDNEKLDSSIHPKEELQKKPNARDLKSIP